MRDALAPYYSHTGCPSIDPELMIRMLIVGYCYGIRSERRLCEEVSLNRLDLLRLSGMWTETRPHLTDWWERVKARPMFEDAMFKYVTPALRQFMTEKVDEAWPRAREILAQIP